MAKHLDKVLKRVKDSKLTIATIARESGIDKRFLYDLVGGKIARPDYERVTELDIFIKQHFNQRLYE